MIKSVTLIIQYKLEYYNIPALPIFRSHSVTLMLPVFSAIRNQQHWTGAFIPFLDQSQDA